MAATIYYDGECPFCARYTALVRLREAVGDVRLVNLREHPEDRAELQRAGFDLDRGMVLDLDGKRYGGADAMHMLSILSAKPGPLAAIFRIGWLAALLYPVLRAGRALALFALGRDRIQADPPDRWALFSVFSHAWGLLASLHLLYYIYYEGSTHVFWTTWAAGALGLYLMLRPRSPRAFVALCGLLTFDAIAQMPVYSNHTILRNFVLLAILAAALYTWARGRSWASFMQAFAPIGRCLLAIMYVFGVFHKINTGFLDPEVSCAVALWETMPRPLSSFNPEWFKYVAIYGTLIGETAILLGLMFKPTRQAAILAGIAFHSLLALAGYGFYPSFSTLAIALHLLFLSPESAQRMVRSDVVQWLRDRPMASAAGLLVWFVILLALTKLGTTSTLGIAWLPWAVVVIYLVARYGRDAPGESTLGPVMVSRSWALNLLTVAFFLNCYAPYLGLKTAQSMNMFANLTVEGGKNNHLLVRHIGPFGYLDDIVKPISGSGYVVSVAIGQGYHLPYYALLDLLERDRSAVVSFERDGVLHAGQSYATLQGDAEQNLHPRWFRNWFLFRPVDLSEQRKCSLSN